MLTYELKKAPGVPLYEALYRCIRGDILSGKLLPGQKLPSKRALSTNLKVSKITVEGAYSQLLEEGYIRSEEKVGYFVEAVEHAVQQPIHREQTEDLKPDIIDLTANGPAQFPFSVWSKLQREVMLDMGQQLLLSTDNQGLAQLRQAIAEHLAAFRGMQVDPANIIIGAGTDFLYNLLIQLLGRDKLYAVEEPGYSKIRLIYAAAGARCVSAELDGQGVDPAKLQDAQVLHISPSHHFPTGLVTPLTRRQALLSWSREKQDRYIIEDDYDSEFRFAAHPMPAMQSLDSDGKVIYMNSFSKSLAPSIRISYMVLPGALMERFRQTLGFYSCTVPSFEQHTLARFLSHGHFEKHINRMRKFYKMCRDRLMKMLSECSLADRLTIEEENAGLHFLVRVDLPVTEDVILRRCAEVGLGISSLSDYYHGKVPQQARKCLVVNYSGLSQKDLTKLEEILAIIH